MTGMMAITQGNEPATPPAALASIAACSTARRNPQSSGTAQTTLSPSSEKSLARAEPRTLAICAAATAPPSAVPGRSGAGEQLSRPRQG